MRASTATPLPERAVPFLIRYVSLRPWHFGAMFLLIVGAASCAVAVQYGMKMLVDVMTLGDRRSEHVWFPFFLFLGLIVVENLFWRLGGWLGCRTVVASCADLRVDLFNHLTGHPMRYFAQHFSGSLANRISSAGAAAGSIYGGLAWKIIPPCVDFLGAVVVLYTVKVAMANVLILCVLLVAALITVVGVRGRSKHIDFAAQSARVGGEMVDLVSNIWTIKAFSARERERQRLEASIGIEARAQRRSWIYLEKARVLHDICLSVMAGGMLGWAILLWRADAVTAGDVVLVSALTFRILHGSRDLALALVDTSQQLGVIADTLRIIIQPYTLSDAQAELKPSRGAIRIIDVAYRYPEGRRIFEHLNLDIPAGQRVGIVGSSGAGKSTLLSLLQRLDDVSSGVILIDDRDIRAVSQDSLRKQIAVVPQEPTLFNRSIYENIAYGLPDARYEDVIQASRQAYCDEFIRALPEGYDTLVGERGVKLSGGQRQRLGLARVFLKNAPILILDEATSALDSHSEAVIQAALAKLMHGRTVLVVAHRLSTVANFDRVIVLHDGQIIEDGPPMQLRRQGGVYESLWVAQTLVGE
ncbi:ABC transporter ATP-binding protein [Pseudomonas viridiflava]|uniref:ABC transporter ATP-binding protein n=1 Tax=Pseudomonas viridiflava TaxID=33069 RepID=UPI000F05B561|nr:ABC transporter ATP-binding protein [Pseudomonas viridiflava]MDY0934763.1 ABC transporter ATP-binding protein [Pseudomonas viridiflava]MDY1014400.1 ABC transporter ATP-binding protein [Pseudomonas viridiflava]TKJ69253.1 ABC transporter [Pseudomonas viridiflava]TKK27836.1 ABC transporter [Pseudomonas viridiflava]